MKGDPQDLKDWAEDLKGCIQRHPDAVKWNPDIAEHVIKARDKAMKRYSDLEHKPIHKGSDKVQ